MRIILLSILAGVIGMGLGAFITALYGARSERMTSIFLSFAGGVMVSIVFLELLPEAVELAGIAVMITGLVLGALLVLALNYLIDKISSSTRHSELHDTFAEFFHSGDIITKNPKMLRSGMIMLVAIALHNVPEGLAMGAAGNYDASLGLTLAILIGLHNIPEGMAVSAPLIAGGMTKIKAVVITLIAGATTVAGTVIGVLMGSISDTAVSFSFAIAGGAMLYVVLGEIIPQSIVTGKDRIPTIFTLAGIIIGVLFIELVH